jgi:hypothetical protein
MANPNSNCLEGMSCPDCGQPHRFKIVGKALFEITDDGTEDYNDVEFFDDDHASCPECHWTGVVGNLREETRSEVTIN